MKKRTKILALLLVLVLVIQLLPVGAFADDIEVAMAPTQAAHMDEGTTPAGEADAEEKQTNTLVIGELPDRRSESEKHFRMDDGSFIAVDYGAPVHYTTDDGETWEDIDNTLVLSGAEAGTAQTQGIGNRGNSYVAENGDTSRSFAADLRSGFLFSTKDGQHSISMGLTAPTGDVAAAAPVEIQEALPSQEDEIVLNDDAAMEVPEDTVATETDASVEAEIVSTVESTDAAEELESTEQMAFSEGTEAPLVTDAVETETISALETTVAVEFTEPQETAVLEITEPQETAAPQANADAAAIDHAQASVKSDAPVIPAFNRSAVAEISYPDARTTNSATDPSGEKASSSPDGSGSMAGNSAGKNNSALPEQDAQGNEKTDETPSLAEQVTPQKLRADVLYRNVFDGVDLSYELYSYNVKETILINRPLDNYVFSFDLDLDGLMPVLMEDGSIELRDDTDAPIYLIPAPYMYDEAGAESDAVSYSLTQRNGAWTLAISADEDWINDENRVFPVAVDPTILSYPYSENSKIYTSYVNSGRPNTTSFENTKFLRSGYYYDTAFDSNCTGYTIGLLYFQTLPFVPDNCRITDARVGLVQRRYGGTDNTNYHKLYATTISTPSNPQTYLSGMTWNSFMTNIAPHYYDPEGTGDDVALDYQKEYSRINANLIDREMQYVITNAVQMWYAGDTSISRLLVLDDGHKTATNARVSYGGHGYDAAYAPRLYLTYRNTVGLEGYYDYHTQTIGRAGTGYINDFTLEPTLSVPILSSPSATLPFGISLIYNEALSYTHFTTDTNNPYTYNCNIHTLNYSNAKTGKGWKTSVQQTVRYGYYYQNGEGNTPVRYVIYTDADGTEHWFSQHNSTVVYKDEDGLGLTITGSDGYNFTMKDKDGNQWFFANGYLTTYTDNNGNNIFYAYDGCDYSSSNTSWQPANNTSSHRVTGVWRKNNGGSSQKIATLEYENNFLVRIIDAAGRTTSLGYSNERLTQITFPDLKQATFDYSQWSSASGKVYHRLTQAWDKETDYRIDYSYWGNRPLQVKYCTESTIAENTNARVFGNRVVCYTSDANYSRFRYLAPGDYDPNYEPPSLAGSGKAVTLHYFDSWGRTINIVTMDPSEEEILGVSTGKYTVNESGSSKNNRLTDAASAGVQSTNLLQNGDLEHSTSLYSWTKDSTGGNAISAENSGTTVLVKPYHGQQLMKLYEHGVNSGEYSVQQSVYLTKDTTYVFSAYVNTVCVDAIRADGGAYLTFLQGDTKKAVSRKLNYKTSPTVDGGWERLEVTYTPSASGTYAVAANIIHTARIVVFDDFQLDRVIDLNDSNLEAGGEQDSAASAYNLLQASSFEFPKPATGENAVTNVSQWWQYNSAKACPTNAKANTGSYGLTFAPCMTDKRRATQTVQIKGSSNKTYILSGWGWTPKTNIKSSKEMEGDNENECRFFGLIAKVTYTESGLEPDYHYLSFNDSIAQWQFASTVIVPKQRNATIETITVSACLDYCVNRAYMDDITLLEEPVQSYDYDDDGNLIASTNSEGNTSTEYDNKDRLSKYTAMTGVEYNLHYANNTTRNPDYMTSGGVKTSYEYESSGSVKKTTVQATAGGKKLESTTNYDSTLNFVASSTDVNGSTVISNYDNLKGTLSNSTDPRGTTTNHMYIAENDRIRLTYSTGLDALYYNYNEKGALEKLSRKSFDPNQAVFWQGYHFDYDEWGNTTGIQVWSSSSSSATPPTNYNSTTLATYLYNNNGTLARMNYPNGDYVAYAYDVLDRLIDEVYYNHDNVEIVRYRYVYNANGQMACQYVQKNGAETESYSFEYDSLGRLIRSREEKGTNQVQRTEHLYDTANRLTKQNWSIGATGFSESYTYSTNDGKMSTFKVKTSLPGGLPYTDYTSNLSYSYDSLKRLTQAALSENTSTTPLYTRNYTYLDRSGGTDLTTSRLRTYVVRDADNSVISGNRYEYDANGNITKIEEVYTLNDADAYRTTAEYTYDALNQLQTETRYTYSGSSAVPATTTTVNYTIDTAGNLRSVSGGEHSVAYAYGDNAWADLLTGITVDNVTRTINYASAGNPSNWYNGTDYTNLTWTQGRRLSSLTKGSQTYSYEYDMSGIRTVKIANGLKHVYVTQNGKVVRESVYGLDSSTGEYTVFQYAMDFTYDEAGHPLTMRTYWDENMQNNYVTMQYVCNAQGDVVKLVYGGTAYAEYTYDAWGNVLTATENGNFHYAAMNPLRYRGYYYDVKSGFYYLQSRYYDPVLGRFINADGYASTGQGFLGYNMFAYCQNNPIISLDYNGGKPRDIQDDYLPIPVRDPSEPIITGYDSSPKAVKEACDTAMNDIASEGGIVKDVSIVYNPNAWIGYPETNLWRVLGEALAPKVLSKLKKAKKLSEALAIFTFLDSFINGLNQNIESGSYETYTITINWDLNHQDYFATNYYTQYSYQTVFLIAVEDDNYTISTWHDFTYTKEVSYALNYR